MSSKEYHTYTKTELINIFDECLNKTLGDVDKNNVFDRTKINPKITGIAGDVIEQSVLGYPSDNRQAPDLNVDGEDVELKTTGIRFSKTDNNQFEAKEPMSITAVSPDKIVHEEFEDSNFWHKVKKMLLVYYLYLAEHTVPASEYANFPVVGYEFHEFSKDEQKALQRDWQIVHDFIRFLQETYDDYEKEYPRISSELRPKLFLLDTAPKWPNHPRFRLKRSFVTSIVQTYFNEHSELEQLPESYTSYADIDKKCRELTKRFGGKTVAELLLDLGVNHHATNKSIGERVAVRMFGGKNIKIGKIQIFREAGIIGKTITITKGGSRTEDMKLFPIDFNELLDPEVEFDNSSFADFFFNHQLLCIIFEEPTSNSKIEENIFVGFKRYAFSDDFINEKVRPVWNSIRKTIFENRLIDVIRLDKDGHPRINKNGQVSSAPNFPKSKDGPVFVRGGGKDSAEKPEEINGVSMYRQYIWLSGKFITTELQKLQLL